MKYYIKVQMLIIFTFFLSVAIASEKEFKIMIEKQINHTVATLTPDEVNNIITSGKKIILLDTREDDEYNISHIKNAIHAGYNKFTTDSIKGVATDHTIILYCSIGYRSEKIGEKLILLGYKNIYNIYGGIFNWVNSDYPVVDNSGEKTLKIHGYSKKWSQWLFKGEKVY